MIMGEISWTFVVPSVRQRYDIRHKSSAIPWTNLNKGKFSRQAQTSRWDLWSKLVIYGETESAFPRLDTNSAMAISPDLLDRLPVEIMHTILSKLDRTSALCLAATCRVLYNMILTYIDHDVRVDSGRWAKRPLTFIGVSTTEQLKSGRPNMTNDGQHAERTFLSVIAAIGKYEDVGMHTSSLQRWRDATNQIVEDRHRIIHHTGTKQLRGSGSTIVRCTINGADCPCLGRVQRPLEQYLLRNHNTHQFVRLCACNYRPHLMVEDCRQLREDGFAPVTLDDFLIVMTTWPRRTRGAPGISYWQGHRFDIVSETSHFADRSGSWEDETSRMYLRMCYELLRCSGPISFGPTRGKPWGNNTRTWMAEDWKQYMRKEIVLDSYELGENLTVWQVCMEWHQKCIEFVTLDKNSGRFHPS